MVPFGQSVSTGTSSGQLGAAEGVPPRCLTMLDFLSRLKKDEFSSLSRSSCAC
jgi:hypothetical protein